MVYTYTYVQNTNFKKFLLFWLYEILLPTWAGLPLQLIHTEWTVFTLELVSPENFPEQSYTTLMSAIFWNPVEDLYIFHLDSVAHNTRQINIIRCKQDFLAYFHSL